jgi:transaldolase
MANQLRQLTGFGQSIWLDNIERSMFASGELRRLIASGVRGLTSNPTIFEHAIDRGHDYDGQIELLAGKEKDPNAIFEALAIPDIQAALDEFQAIYEATGGADGFVSFEVAPRLARDAHATIASAKRLWAAIDRPNLMIKIPGTEAGAPAIAAAIAAGINVNVTLLFSLDAYERAANAYIDGLEARASAKLPLHGVTSVASFFLSRIDTEIDRQLEDKIAAGQVELEALRGKAAIAQAKLAYLRFKALFGGERFKKLAALGATVQRPLWASTSTKNPHYADLKYVESLVAPHTVNTIPPKTLAALLDHGNIVGGTAETDPAGVRKVASDLANAGISIDDVTADLEAAGVKSFAASYDLLLSVIASKQRYVTGAVA